MKKSLRSESAYGEKRTANQGRRDTEVFGARLHALSGVRSSQGGLSQVPALSYLFSESGVGSEDSRCQEGQLVIERREADYVE